MATVRRPSAYSHVIEQKLVKHSYDGILADESDVLLCDRPRLWLDHTKLVTLFRTAENHEQARTDCKECWIQIDRFEKDKNCLGETQPHTCWVICDYVPVCVAIDRLLPCTSAELLAFHFTQNKSSSPLAADAQTQQGFIDERASLDFPTIADPSRIANDEHDDEMSEPTQTSTAEKRKAHEAAIKLRALLPLTSSSHASSSRTDDETQEQFTRSVKQARTTETEVEKNTSEMDFSMSEWLACAKETGRNCWRRKMVKAIYTLRLVRQKCKLLSERRDVLSGKMDEFLCRCQFDEWKSKSTHRSKLRDLPRAMDRSGQTRTKRLSTNSPAGNVD